MEEIRKMKLVTTVKECDEIFSHLSGEKVLAVDCQGVYRGPLLRLTLLQIGTSRGDVYLFDVHENRNLLYNGPLKALLESEEIEKVMFKCSKDSGELYHSFGTTLRNVFDIQDAHIILQEEKNDRKLFPTLLLRDICLHYSSTDKVAKDEEEIMKICSVEGNTFWETRPLTDKMMSVAAGNVKALIPELYGEQKRLIDESGLNLKFRDRVQESVQLNIDPAIKKNRRDRIHERAMEILNLMGENCTVNATLQDFEEDCEERLALRIVDFENVQNLPEIIQQLKKEQINCYLDRILDETKTDNRESLVNSAKLTFLTRNRCHPDKSIARKAMHIRKEIEKIILASIENKYTETTDLSLLSISEQEILRVLPIWSEKDTEFTKLIRCLFWKLLVDDIARKNKALHRYKEGYKLNKHFYDKMNKFASCPSSVPIPDPVRENVAKFLEDIRLYNINTS